MNNSEKNYICTINIQIAILQNQHSGKDTHIRQIKIFGPREKINQGLGFPDFKSAEFTQYYSVRWLSLIVKELCLFIYVTKWKNGCWVYSFQ